MKNYTIRPYESGDYEIWNTFLATAQNATFLFHRDFMEYHSDRFDDFSLLVFDAENPIALLPANKKGSIAFSHQGLTYGGLVYQESLDQASLNAIITVVIKYLKHHLFTAIYIKGQPGFYQAEDFNALLKQNGAVVDKSEMSLAIDFSKELKISKSKRKHFRRISGLGLEIRKEQSFDLFWDTVLIPRLEHKHNASPVHTKEEIAYLCARFPQNIFQYNVYLNDEILAGITVFLSGTIVKSQYGATTEQGEKYRALDYLFISLIQDFNQGYTFFDMGTVSDKSEKGFNQGLLTQKLELGCSIYNQDFYSLTI